MSPDIKIYVNFLQHIPQTQPIQSVFKKFKSRCYVRSNIQLPATNFWMFTTDRLWRWSRPFPDWLILPWIRAFCHLQSFSQTILPKISIMLPSIRYIGAPYYENIFIYITSILFTLCSVPVNIHLFQQMHRTKLKITTKLIPSYTFWK